MDLHPKIPTLKDAHKPQVKIKGMGAGLTLFDRLKQFKKKDLAFIFAGLGTLCMAPLAEHFMMAPENGASDMSQGFRGGGGAGGSGLFGGGSSPHENSNSYLASGGAIGGGGDIITPLNVRDPSALVMGPGGTQQPPAGSAAPAMPSPTAPADAKVDYRDALAGAASRAATAAVKRAPLPIPKVALGGSGLRGLGAASGGGSSASGSLAPINSGVGGTAGTGGGGLNLVRANPQFRGSAVPRGNAPTGLDGTKRAGANAGDAFSRSGSALAGLNAAANEQIPTGGTGLSGAGQGGVGANDKAPGGGAPGGSKSVGESLAFLEAKQRQEERLKLEFEKKRLADWGLLGHGIKNDVFKAAGGKLGEAMTKEMFGLMCRITRGTFMCPSSGGKDGYTCTDGRSQTGAQIAANMCSGAGKPGEAAGRTENCFTDNGNGTFIHLPSRVVCSPTEKNNNGGDAKSKTENSASTAPPTLSSGQAAAVRGLGEACKLINAPRPGPRTKIDDYFDTKMKPVAVNADLGRVLLEGGAPECGGTVPAEAGGRNAAGLIKTAKAKLSAAKGLSGPEVGTLTQMVDLVPGSDGAKVKELAAVFDTVTNEELKKAKDIIKLAQDLGTTDLASPTPADNDGAIIDEVVMKMAGDIQLSRGAVASEAASLAASVKSLEDIIATAKTEIADETGKGSLSDTIMLNKGLMKFEEQPPAMSAPPAIENKSSIRADQDAARTALTDTDKMLPLPAPADETNADYKEKKDAFLAKSAAAKTAVEGVRTKQTEMIKGTATLVDATKVDTLLR